MRKNIDLSSKKQLIEILAVTLILGIALLISDYIKTRVDFDGTIERNEAGKGNVTKDLELEFLNQKQSMTVDVTEISLSPKDVEKKFDMAIKEIEKTYLGRNKSADKVSYDLSLKDSYVDGLITAEWTFDQYGYFEKNGKIRSQEIPPEGAVVGLTAVLRYEEAERLYSFSVVAIQKSMKTLDGQLEAISRQVQQQDKKTRADKKLQLPKEVEKIKIIWKEKMNYRGLHVILLGLVAVVGIYIGKRRDGKLELERLKSEKEQDYPLIVSELSILMAAGMSFRKALEKIVGKYIKAVKEKGMNTRAGFEDIVLTYRKMADGLSEIQALEELGKNSESKEYRKLSMLLIQNLRKGSKDLIDCLEKEEKYAYEMRKQRALRAGEEASTKLLIPMAGMLFIVIVILVVPAIMQMNM
ncbi:MAG: type II secretion system F family protein [Pseudobutyrivibrio sp.]|nr:type II secretion system F family protein [Pseudobutyrivibrio sp.]